ncbi:MAG: hypothetical protein EOO77_35235 [Oxalobacteraceae bacterium]|nr:MAG: hypothetical protein EOO77_35235 [Oxalobacteraceae bacterium]
MKRGEGALRAHRIGRCGGHAITHARDDTLPRQRGPHRGGREALGLQVWRGDRSGSAARSNFCCGDGFANGVTPLKGLVAMVVSLLDTTVVRPLLGALTPVAAAL